MEIMKTREDVINLGEDPIIAWLCWDSEYLSHREANDLLGSFLEKNSSVLYRLTLPRYYASKHMMLGSVLIDPVKSIKRFSKRLRLRYALSRFKSKALFRLERFIPKLLESSSHYSYHSVNIDPLKGAGSIKNRLMRLSVNELAKFEYRGIQVFRHCAVDMSLDCKIALDSIKKNSLEHCFLIELLLVCCQAIDGIFQFIEAFPDRTVVFISTSVYTLDWVAKEVVEKCEHIHRTLERAPGSTNYKIYSSQPYDIHRRHLYQENISMNPGFLSKSIIHAKSYLAFRFSDSSSHRYSPLSFDASIYNDILTSFRKSGNGSIWTYFSNSPDELISINHAIQESKANDYIPLDLDSWLQDEYQALKHVAECASELRSFLIIRLHPRLAADHRCQLPSSSYEQMMSLALKLREQYPESIYIVEPGFRVNSYELAYLSDKTLSFRGTMPLELALMGLKTIVLAKNLGIMNYRIRSMALSAPSCKADLMLRLKSDSLCYSLQELACFLQEYYVAEAFSVLDICVIDDESREAFLSALLAGHTLPGVFAADASLSNWPECEKHVISYLSFVSGFRDRIMPDSKPL